MPDDIGKIILNTAFAKRTVCEVTREIYDLICEHKAVLGPMLFKEIEILLKEQAIMQKKMDGRLRFYKKDWLDDENLPKTEGFLDKMVMREQRANATL